MEVSSKETGNHDDQLSQHSAEISDSYPPEAALEDVFDNVNCDRATPYESSVPQCDKMNNDYSLHDLDPTQRPRSFSDVSAGSGRYTFLRKLQGQTDKPKTSMKVFVRRESKTITGQSAKHDDTEFGFHPYQHGIYKQANAISLSVNNIADAETQVPPPKPRLPDNYRRYLDQQLKQFHQVHSKSLDSGSEEGKVEHAQQKYVNVQSVNPEEKRESIAVEHQRVSRPRASVSELPIRTTSGVYKHFDAKFQSELLKKELEKLRTYKHVRKNSETMKQKFESIFRQKSTSDLHVRFVDEMDDQQVGTKDKDIVSDKTGKHTFKQAHSLDSAVIGNRTFPNDIAYNQGGSTGTIQGQSCSYTTDVVRDGRSRTSERGQELGRSKSATALNRQRDEDASHLRDKKGSQLSKSASNLRRNPDTIRRYNAGTHEQIRINVRQKYEADRHNRVESTIPDDPALNLEQELGKGREKLERRASARDHKPVSDNRSDEEKYAALSRNRTLYSKSGPRRRERPLVNKDERMKLTFRDRAIAQSARKLAYVKPNIVVNGSESAQSKLGADVHSHTNIDIQNDLHRSRNTHTKGAIYESKSVPNISSKDQNKQADQRTDPPSEKVIKHSNLHSVPKKVTINEGDKIAMDAKSNQTLDLDKIVIDARSKLCGRSGDIVLKQCRVGSDVVFGLVGVPKPSLETHHKHKEKQPSSNGYLDGQGLVTIRMMPDDQGRFGFNVKGGADQGMPIIVSRVAPNTPADNADPRLNEGDQVLYINGRDVSQHTHEQVVKFIRLSRETRTKELNLIVRPNAYMTDDASDDQPEEFVYDPESYLITNNSGGNALDNSLHLLEESLESGAALAQFEQLYRKKPGMTMNVARSVANVPKNRYRDISPYDQTRVLIKSGPNGDYINANYVNMEIPVSGIVNRYIAAQGPLPTTCVDFWQMVWEQHSSLVVMLTTEVEKGRIKCHQYWPGLYETSDFGHLQITCVKEEKSPSFAFREFNLTNVESEEERHISHMQYISWPDHGVPDDPADFLDFVVKVRQKRVGVVEPSVVHCSAGIGRTGVLITMETAMCLIEANQPVFPLSIVRQMRDQRAMLIQTPNQYKFVCEAIIRCFSERIVEPLPEYQQR
ncbi:uncharacterized protein LOC128237607 isoform X2 [Mya arenaria]|uniref:uncharacterized protein LOC128237607 isoform X2 n=1 Tax=Mya arenaria TaxID=6604 RepID=UPI0022E5576E|nr:uncharacterized protein LOC128237607 isoform X2 [Mya arenaria]XP_052809172.1 uncharacterized protein LOC128237607 isoform X2 [Mya arenaria]XP_052809178.1 uncharacterized protein LOC128237607 isoform X2 [Mya arenaria]XP_052809185.1 uncharacterized protein LOC128237607 isoform X2 [Mya arenaria]